jgi:hypothetical protein
MFISNKKPFNSSTLKSTPPPIQMDLPTLPTLSPYTGETTETAPSQSLFSSSENDSPTKVRSVIPIPQDKEDSFRGDLLSPNSRQKADDWKKSRQLKTKPINLQGRNTFWPVRHLQPKDVFTIPWERKRSVKDNRQVTSYYYVCEEQVLRSEREGNSYLPYEIRPSFIKRRGVMKRHLEDSADFFPESPAKRPDSLRKNMISKHGIIQAASPVGTPPNGQVIVEDSSSGDEDLPSLKEIFQNTGAKSTPPASPIPPSTPVLPQPIIQEDGTSFRCDFQSEKIKFQLIIKK